MKNIDYQFNAIYLASKFECPFTLIFTDDNVTEIDFKINKKEGYEILHRLVANFWKFYPGTKVFRTGNELTITKDNDKFSLKFNFLKTKQEFINPNPGEQESDFMSRCIPYVMEEGKEQDQAVAICSSKWEDRYQNFESVSDYPKGISETAQRVLNWVEENGWGSCGTAVGKIRASQLAKGEPISIDTIKRMYSFLARHKGQGADKGEYGDGCGRLMYDAWGGDAALSWSERFLNARKKEEKFYIFRLFVTSSNIDGLQYDTEKQELDITFHDGSVYRYYDVNYETFEDVWKGRATCTTSGSSPYGSWFVGKTPSNGAALWRYLIRPNVRKEKIR